MTGSEALRKGAKTFATEMASLTGGKKDVGPPPRPLLRNTNVEVTVKGKWYPGKIDAVDDKQRVYTVEYTDTRVEENVAESRIRVVGEGRQVGGVLFLDEAYDLDPANNPDGKAILAEIMSVAEDHRDTGKISYVLLLNLFYSHQIIIIINIVTIILAGYKQDIEDKLYSFNVGMPSRFVSVMFDDFSEDQLGEIWRKLCNDSGWKVR